MLKVFVLLFIMVQGVMAFSAKEYYTICKSSDEKRKVLCMGYLNGVMDATNVHSYVYKTKKANIGKGVDFKELRKVILDYIKRNPQYHKHTAAYSIDLALFERYGVVFPNKK